MKILSRLAPLTGLCDTTDVMSFVDVSAATENIVSSFSIWVKSDEERIVVTDGVCTVSIKNSSEDIIILTSAPTDATGYTQYDNVTKIVVSRATTLVLMYTYDFVADYNDTLFMKLAITNFNERHHARIAQHMMELEMAQLGISVVGGAIQTATMKVALDDDTKSELERSIAGRWNIVG